MSQIHSPGPMEHNPFTGRPINGRLLLTVPEAVAALWISRSSINKLVGSAGLAVMATVLLSIFAHGLTAQPTTNLYARRIAALDETSPEDQKLGDGSPEPAQMPHFGI